MKLRDALLDALDDLPGSRRFHLHVLVSAPRKYTSLFPYATTRPRVYAQDILVLCSEQKDAASPRILVTAIEAAVYNIPASSSAIFYVSKVDSTGQGMRPSPTAALVRALLKFYINPTTRPLAVEHLWVHLFARAQSQYLFPNSAEHPDKKPLGDVKLCAWWKRVYTHVARELMETQNLTLPPPKLYYVLPGMDELEAKQALGELSAANVLANAVDPHWTYGHPYSQAEVRPPCAAKRSKDTRHNLGLFIPSFEDDPKSRFLDEIACTTQVDGLRSPKRKRAKASVSVSVKPQASASRDGDGDENGGGGGGEGGIDGNASHVDPGPPGEKKEKKEKEDRIPGELGIVSADEFWERMSFRQECVAGAVTGFFVAIYSWPSSTSTSSSEGVQSSNPLAPQSGQVSFHMVRRIVSSLTTGHDFSTTEKALRATEVLEGAIEGLCSGLTSSSAHHANSSMSTSASGALVPVLAPNNEEERKTPEPELPLPFVSGASPKTPPRRLASLPSMDSTGMSLGVPRFNNLDNDVSPNPFPEPIASSDTYHQFIYGSISIANPEAALPSSLGGNGRDSAVAGVEEKATPTVTVLAVRKKKKR